MLQKLDYSYLVKYRTALMGFCIIWIYFFHITTKNIILDPLTQIGWCGVDCFFLLSGLGLSHSLCKNSNIREFYVRRVMRILPTWLVLIFGFHIINLYIGKPCPHTFCQSILYYTGAGWFFNGCFDVEKVAWSEWYVPTLLMFYIIAPLFHKMKTRLLIVAMVVFFVIGICLSYYNIIDSLKLSYFRLPSFIFGFVVYRGIVYQKEKVSSVYYTYLVNLILLVLGILCLLVLSSPNATTKHPDTYIESLGAILITPGILQIVTLLCQSKYVTVLLNSFGKVSLELYLIHVFFIAIAWRMRTELQIPDTLVLVLALSIYWLMSWSVSLIMKFLSNCLKRFINGWYN